MSDETPIRIDNIYLEKSRVDIQGLHKPFVFHIEMGGYKFTGYFDTWPGFLTMVSEAGTWYAMKWGKLSRNKAQKSLTRNLH